MGSPRSPLSLGAMPDRIGLRLKLRLLWFLCSINRHRGGVRLPGARRAAAVGDVSLQQFFQALGHLGVLILEICPLANVGGEVVELNRRQTPRESAPRPWRAPTAG